MTRKRWLLWPCLAWALIAGPAAADGLSDAGTAYAAAKQGNYARAVRYYNRAIWSGELSEREAMAAYFGRGLSHVRLENYADALADYDHVIEIAPTFAPAYYNRAVTYTANGDDEAALADYTEAIWLGYSERHRAFFNRGTIYESQGDFESAVADFKEAYRLAPDEPMIRAKADSLGLTR